VVFLLLCCAVLCAAHDDVVDGPRGVENVTDPLIGQGRNTSQDRAYAWWAQYDDNLTDLLADPWGKQWVTVAEAIPWAKRLWDVNILDETGDPEVGRIRFAMGFGPVEREMALPLFLEALAAAVHGRQDCYVEQDQAAGIGGLRNYHKGAVHIRRARPLQPDYDHPYDPDKAAIRRLEEAVAAQPVLTDLRCAPAGVQGERCMDCQAAAARVISQIVAQYGVAALNADCCLTAMADACKACRHCRAGWISRHKEPHEPEVLPGATGQAGAPAAQPEAKAPEKK
jgi:hypothetical protein